jgi:hypothetical protein
MFLWKRSQNDTKHFIPNSFLRRAVEHIEKTGEPLLYCRLPHYSRVLSAWADEDRYALSVPMEHWEPPFRTWREYAETKGLPLQEVMDDQEFEDEDELDEEIETGFLYQMVDPLDTPEGQTAAILGDLPQYLIEDAGDLEPLLDETLVEVYEDGGSYPGDPWTGRFFVHAPSKLSVSLLQYVLDELGSGIRIELSLSARIG